MVDGFIRTSAQRKNGAPRLKDSAAIFLRTKAAPIQICSIGLVQRMGLARCQCGQIKTALLSFSYSSRDWGHQSHQSRKQILPSRTPRLAAEAKASRHDRPYR